MLAGVALAYSTVPLELVAQHGLQRRVCDRGGEKEIQFLLRDRDRVLPVWLDGQFRLVQWGNKRRQGTSLPVTAWTKLATLQDGGWGAREVTQVVIPAVMGFDRGIWFQTTEGLHGIVIRDEQEKPVVYVLVEPASHYYEVMTRSPWMPVLVGERI